MYCLERFNTGSQEDKTKFVIILGVTIMLVPGAIMIIVGYGACPYTYCCPSDNNVCGLQNNAYTYYGPCGGGLNEDFFIAHWNKFMIPWSRAMAAR